MHLKTRNVNTAFRELVRGIYDKSIPTIQTNSRNGGVLQVVEPVLVTYSHPTERVLFNTARDCNCFFSLYEALWMLAGRNDLAPLLYYNSKMGQFSDDGKTLNAAYGYRWRYAHTYSDTVIHCDGSEGNHEAMAANDGLDQLNILVEHLKSNPESRRAVLQMWNVEDDLLKIGGDQHTCPKCEGRGEECQFCCNGTVLNSGSKDVCCNLSVMFSLRSEPTSNSPFKSTSFERDKPLQRYLDMTVTNRSNDMIWGMLGANYVHFTILQEYIAARLGVEVGVYNHFTNNCHLYLSNCELDKWLSGTSEDYPQSYSHHPLVADPLIFEKEIYDFVELNSKNTSHIQTWKEPFLEHVAQPMLTAFHLHKNKKYSSAYEATDVIMDEVWKVVAARWIKKRETNYVNKRHRET